MYLNESLVIRFDNIVQFGITPKIVSEHASSRISWCSPKVRSENMNCPVCGGKLDKLRQLDKRSLELEVWLRCEKCKQLTRHARSFTSNPEQFYECQECFEMRKLVNCRRRSRER